MPKCHLSCLQVAAYCIHRTMMECCVSAYCVRDQTLTLHGKISRMLPLISSLNSAEGEHACIASTALRGDSINY